MIIEDFTRRLGLTLVFSGLGVLVVALLHFLGALIYFFVGRPKRKLAPV